MSRLLHALLRWLGMLPVSLPRRRYSSAEAFADTVPVARDAGHE